MTPVLEALKRQLSNNQLSSHYAEQLFASMDKTTTEELTGILQETIQRYASIPVISGVLNDSTDATSHLQAIFDVLPLTFFLISNDLYREATHFKSAKLLQIAGIASTITRDPNENAHVRLFVESIDPDDSLEELIKKIQDDSTNGSYIPKVIYKDFGQIRKKYKNLIITKDIHELIDMIFGFQGLLQIFLRYYFELICAAKSDAAARLVDIIFSNLFATLRYQEIKYWNNYSDSRTLQNEIFHIIKIDGPSQRHPVLRKHLFDSLKQYHPIIKDARSHYSAPDVRQMHMGQLDDYNALSIPRMAVLLRTVSRCKGKSNLVYLLSQTLKSQNQKLYQLNEYVQAEEFQKDTELIELIQYFVDKLSSTQQRANRQSSRSAEMGTVIQTAESLRRLKAKKLLKEREAKAGLNYEQVNRLIKEKFKKMYSQAKSSGGLTANSASDHLTTFAAIAQPLLLSPVGAPRQKAVQEFSLSAQEMLKGITDQGHLTAKDTKEFTLKISAINKQLSSASPETQAEIMEKMGITISNAANRSQKRYEIKVKKTSAGGPIPQALTHDQVTRFLENRLGRLYKHVRQDGALTQDKVTAYLSKFTSSAQPLMMELSAEKQKVEIEKFVVSTNEILAGFTENGALADKPLKQIKNKIQQLTIQLKSPDVEKRSRAIEEIGITLSLASKQAGQSGSASSYKAPRKVFPKALTQDQIPDFLEAYLKKMYAKARKDGALTYDQISQYLSQFAATAQHIVVAMPPLKRKQVITEFKVSTEGILANITRESDLSQNQIREFRIKLHGQIGKLDVEDVEERIEVVDQIGLILADASNASDASKKKADNAFDEEFYKKDCIPYGLDKSAKLISMDQFFAFPFGDRRGPSEKDWFNFHIRYLQMAVDKNKIDKPVFEKISSMLPQVPKKKYRKYFNIFPSEKFEETTFLAVYDLWQNKALEKLVVE